MLAHPNLISSGVLLEPGETATRIGAVGDYVLGALWDGRAAPVFKKLAAADVKAVRIDINGVDHIAIYKWIDRYGPVPWGIGLWTQASDLTSEIKRLRFAASVGVGIAVLAVLAAILLGRLLARPIRVVSSNALKVGDFDLQDIEILPPSRIREIDDEAVAFNRMLAGLRSFETYVPHALVARLMRSGGADGVLSEQAR